MRASLLIDLSGTIILIYSGYGFMIPWFYLQDALFWSAAGVEEGYNRFSWSR